MIGNSHQRGPYRHRAPSGVWRKALPTEGEKYAENLLECRKFHTVQPKKFQRGNFERGCPPSLRPWRRPITTIEFNLPAKEYSGFAGFYPEINIVGVKK